MIGTCYKSELERDVIKYTHTAATTAWTPIYVSGLGVLIPQSSKDTGVENAFYRVGIFKFYPTSGVSVVKGTKVYYNSATGKIDNTAPAAGFLLGTALESGTGTSSGSVAINVDIGVYGEEGLINVYDSTGKFKASYATIDLAASALVANDIMRIGQGSHSLSAGVDITKAGVKIYGAGKKLTTVVAAAAADYAFKTLLGALTGSSEVFFGDMTIDHGDDATQVGIQVDNALATKKLIVFVDNVDFESDGGNSVDVDHTDTTSALRVRVSNSYLEGPVNMVVAHDEDQLHITDNCDAVGGVVTSDGAYTAVILLENSKVLKAGVTGGASQQTLYASGMLAHTDANPDVYSAFVTTDAAGSHTESLISP
jgi:hypothetical protein